MACQVTTSTYSPSSLNLSDFPHTKNMMSGSSLKDLNTLPGSPKKSCSKNGNGKLKECQNGNSVPSIAEVLNGDAITNQVGETGTAEVEYIDSENLKDVEDKDTILQTLLVQLESKDWVSVCEALNNVRRLTIFHKEVMLEMLGNVILLLVKSLKNPRSAVCKTALMTSADIFGSYGDHVIESLDPLLVQLLLKASQDKKFVCEAAEKALIAMTTSVPPSLLLPKLQPHLKHRNPRIRAKASMCVCRSVPRLGIEGIREYGIDKLVQMAASQLSDKLPESREAARTLLLELRVLYEKSHVHMPSEPEKLETDTWEVFCQSKLSALSAQAVLRVTSVAQEGLVLSP